MPMYIVHPRRNADAWQRRVKASSPQHAIAAVLRDAGYRARVSKSTGEVKSNVSGGGDGGLTARPASSSRRPNPSKNYLPILTSRDRAQIKRVARELADMGEHEPETVMLSSGYAEVWPASGGYASVVRHGRTTRVRLTATPRRRNPSKKRPTARACSSRGWKLKMAPSRRSGQLLRQCRSNPRRKSRVSKRRRDRYGRFI